MNPQAPADRQDAGRSIRCCLENRVRKLRKPKRRHLDLRLQVRRVAVVGERGFGKKVGGAPKKGLPPAERRASAEPNGGALFRPLPPHKSPPPRPLSHNV